MTNIVSALKEKWWNYLWQSFCAAAAMYIVLTALSLQHALIVSSFGATAFIVFMKPHNPFATPRNVVGGHLVGLVTGVAFSLLPHTTPTLTMLTYALAVSCAMLVMAVSNTEHPPAAGTTLSVVTTALSWKVVLAVVTGAVLLALFHEVLKPYLKDL